MFTCCAVERGVPANDVIADDRQDGGRDKEAILKRCGLKQADFQSQIVAYMTNLCDKIKHICKLKTSIFQFPEIRNLEIHVLMYKTLKICDSSMQMAASRHCLPTAIFFHGGAHENMMADCKIKTNIRKWC